jgi:predicted ester cyclase
VLHKALSDIKVEIYEQIAEGDTVVTRKAITGVQTGEFMGQAASGKRVSMYLIDIVKLKNGQYTEHWRYGQVISNAG